MASVFDSKKSKKSVFDTGEDSGSIFDSGKKAKPLEDVGFLEKLAETAKATPTFQTLKSAGRIAVDLIGRPGYATVGAIDELTGEGDVGSATRRALSEVFSGIGSVQGQKKGTGQILEERGVPELGKLSDIPGPSLLYSETGEGLPLQRGGILDPTGRGALGLGGDIITDPTTWTTFGGAPAMRFLSESGKVVYLSKPGIKALQGIDAVLAPKLAQAAATTNDVLRVAARKAVAEERKKLMAQAIKADPKLLGSEGIKMFGKEVVSERALKGLSDPVKAAVLSVPGGGMAARGAQALENGIRRVFDPFAELANLPPEIREGAKAIIRENKSAAGMTKTNLFSRWADVENAYAKEAKKLGRGAAGKEELGKKFAGWREQTSAYMPTPEQRAVFKQISDFYDEMEVDLLREGVLEPGQTIDNYLHHQYKNPEVLQSTTPSGGRIGDKVISTEKFQRERHFKTYQEAEEWTKARRAEDEKWLNAGLPVKVRGVLKPEYDATKNLGAYLQQSNDAIWRKKTFDEITAKYGVEVPNVAPGSVYDLTTTRVIPASDRRTIDGFIGESKTLNRLAEDLEVETFTAKTPELSRANTLLRQVVDSAPLKFYEKETLKNLDEVRYYRRRGWEIAEEGDGKYVAYKANDVGTAEYASWNARLKEAQQYVRAATGRASRERGLGVEGWDELTKGAKTLLPRLSPDGQRELARELTSMARSPGQVLRISEALGRNVMPAQRLVPPGTVEPFYKKLALDGTMVPRSGGLWGDKEILVPQAIASMLEKKSGDVLRGMTQNKAWHKFIDGWDWYMDKFRALTYPFYPSGAFRDTYNNLMHNFLALGVEGVTHPFRAAKVLKNSDDAMRVGAHELKGKEWNRFAQDLGVTDPKGGSFAQFSKDRGVERPGLLAKARATRAQVDNYTRTQLWLNAIDQGATLEDAAQLVKEYLYDYSELSRADRDLFKRVFGFPIFPRKSFELYGKVATKTPGRIINLARPFRGREDENNAMTTWEGEGFKIRLDRDGKNITVLNGVDLPIRSLDLIWKGEGTKTLEGLVSMMGPGLKIPYMLTTGRDPFRGKEMTRGAHPTLGRIAEKLPAPLRAWVGYEKTRDKAGRPVYTLRQDRVQTLMEATLISRIVTTSDRQFREQASNPSTARWLLDLMTGTRLKTLNLDEEGERKKQERIRYLQEQLVKQGPVKRGDYYFIPKPKK